jgi:hypothetical protein
MKKIIVKNTSTASGKIIWDEVGQASKGAPTWAKNHVVKASKERALALTAGLSSNSGAAKNK